MTQRAIIKFWISFHKTLFIVPFESQDFFNQVHHTEKSDVFISKVEDVIQVVQVQDVVVGGLAKTLFHTKKLENSTKIKIIIFNINDFLKTKFFYIL